MVIPPIAQNAARLFGEIKKQSGKETNTVGGILVRIKAFIIRHPLLIFLISAIGVGVLEFIIQRVIHYEPSWFNLLAIVVLHVLRLFLMAQAIVCVIWMSKGFRNHSKE